MKRIFAFISAAVLLLAAVGCVKQPESSSDSSISNSISSSIAEPVPVVDDNPELYEFEPAGDGTGMKLTKYSGTGSIAVIPSEADGKPVTVIGAYAFYNCIHMREVSIPNTVIKLESRAFENCNGLTVLNIPDNVITLEVSCVNLCDMVTGRLSEERFNMLSETYDEEQAELKERLPLLETEVNATHKQTDDLEKFIAKVKQITEVKMLTPELVHEFIERIDVYKPYRENGKRIQQIDILYNGVGVIRLPNAEEMEELFQKHIAKEKRNTKKTA